MSTASNALVALSNEIAATVERAAPSVVAVEARQRIGSSGFFVRPNLVLTADHAIENDDVEIVGADGTAEAAEVVGRDASTDLALLRTKRTGTPLPFAGDAGLKVGALVIAVARDDDGDLGASMGVLSTVSGRWRSWHGGEIDSFVRPDLGLYARFSGSPLLDASGAALGLNTPGLSRRQSLTVPAATIERVVEQLLSRGRIARGYLGIALQHVELPRGFGNGSGSIVISVEQDGPADRAGVIVGDIVTGIGGGATDIEGIHTSIASAAIGSELALDVVRGGERRTIAVTVGERPEREE